MKKRMKPDTLTPQERELFGRVPKGKQKKLTDEMAEWLDTVFEDDQPSAMAMLEKIAEAAGVTVVVQNSALHLEDGLDPHATDDMMMILSDARTSAATHRRAPQRTIAAIVDLLERTGPQ